MTLPIGRRCEGVTRRDILHIGSLTALGLGLNDWFGSNATAAERIAPRAKSCILIWLDGGPSHLEMFDPKPEAPLEVRGPFASIPTKVPGVHLSELLPRSAKVMDKLAVVRSITSPLGEHGLANHYLMTGYQPSPVLQYPSYGAVLSRMRPQAGELPSYIAVPQSRSGGAGFLGASFEPFTTEGDPSKSDFQVRDLDLYPGLNDARIARRREFLRTFETGPLADKSSNVANDSASNRASDSTFEQAYRLLTSTNAKSAFNLNAEPESVRVRYGPRTLGQSCLLARRLVEAGVPFVTVVNSGWDTHDNLVVRLRDGYSGAKVGVGLIPTFDQAFAALVSDLAERNLLDETLVIAMGEFGRTPKLNTNGGRDHWPRVFSLALAGGGISGGQVIGASDRIGESPLERPITPNDLARTIYTILGVNPDHQLVTADGRPVPINQGGSLISELL